MRVCCPPTGWLMVTPHLCDFMEDKFLGGQVDTIREVSTWITKLKRVASGLGYHIIDTEVAT